MSCILYMAPNCLSENAIADVLSVRACGIMKGLRRFFVEDTRTARRFLSRIGHPVPISELQFYELNEHSTEREIHALLSPLLAGDSAMLSEAGLPGVADPGSALVQMAHSNGVRVVPLEGPSSIVMALMASGLNGQSFAFWGYLPVKDAARAERIHSIEHRSAADGQTQIFIETPYRNMKMLETLTAVCHPETQLCVAADITGEHEMILTKPIKEWRNSLPNIHKVPAVFLLQAVIHAKTVKV